MVVEQDMPSAGSPGDWEPRLIYAVGLSRDDQVEAACSEMLALVELYPDVAPLRAYCAGYLWRLGHCEKALPHAQRATELSPKKEWAARLLCHIYLDLGRYADALAEADRFRPWVTDPDDADLWASLVSAAENAIEEERGQG